MVLFCPEWEEKYPLSILQAFPREVSDRTPLFIDSGSHSISDPIFFFENSWVHREGFREFVTKAWHENYKGDNLERWQQRMRNLRRKTKGWNKNVDALYRKIKKDIMSKLDDIDKRAETMGLTACDREEQKELSGQLARIMKQEEIKWLRRYKDGEIKDGDGNTRYYHAKVNGRRRKNRITSLEQEEGVIEGDRPF